MKNIAQFVSFLSFHFSLVTFFPNENSNLRAIFPSGCQDLLIRRWLGLAWDVKLMQKWKISAIIFCDLGDKSSRSSARFQIRESRNREERKIPINWIMLRKRNEAFAINSKYYDIMSRFHPSLSCQIIWYQIYVESSSLSLRVFMWQQHKKINNLSSTVY